MQFLEGSNALCSLHFMFPMRSSLFLFVMAIDLPDPFFFWDFRVARNGAQQVSFVACIEGLID